MNTHTSTPQHHSPPHTTALKLSNSLNGLENTCTCMYIVAWSQWCPFKYVSSTIHLDLLYSSIYQSVSVELVGMTTPVVEVFWNTGCLRVSSNVILSNFWPPGLNVHPLAHFLSPWLQEVGTYIIFNRYVVELVV